MKTTFPPVTVIETPKNYTVEAAPPADIKGSYVTPDGKAQIDFGITYRNGYPEFTASGHYDGGSGQNLEQIAAVYPEDPTKAVIEIWKNWHLKNLDDETGMTAIICKLAAKHPFRSFYDTQATRFLESNGLKFRATLSDSKTPAWAEDGKETGHHYRVTIIRGRLPLDDDKPDGYLESDRDFQDRTYKCPLRLTFDYWGSIADAQCQCCKGKKTVKLDTPEPGHIPNPELGTFKWTGEWSPPQGEQRIREKIYRKVTAPSTLNIWIREKVCPECKGTGQTKEPKHPSAYDVLSCISRDAHSPVTFADFCSEFDHDTDSIKARQLFNRCLAFSRRLQAFFTPAELEQLAEIR